MSYNIGAVIASVKADVTDFKQGMAEVKATASGLSSHFSGMGDSIRGVVAGIGKHMVDTFQQAVKQSQIVLAAMGAGLAYLGNRALSVAGDLQQAQSAYETLLKSEKKATEALDAIKKDAAKTPFDMRELIRGNQMLISTGESVEKSREAVLALGNAIVATGGGQAEFSRMVANLQQVRNVGVATAMDIRQFGFAGINIYKLLAESTGKSVAELKEMDITYEDLTGALINAQKAGGSFAGALEKQAGNWNLVKSNLQDVINIILADIVTETGIFGYLNTQLITLVGWLTTNKGKIVGFFNDIKTGVMLISDAFNKDWDIGAWLSEDDYKKFEPFIEGLRKLQPALSWFASFVVANKDTIISFLQGMAAGFAALLVIAALTSLANPIVQIATLVGLLFAAWQSNFLGIKDITQQVVTFIIDLWNAFLLPAMLYLVAAVQQNWAIISSTIKLAWDVIAGIIRTGTALVLAIVFTFLAIFTGRWDIAWKYIQNLVTVAWNSVKAIFNSALGFIGSWAGAVYNQLTSPFKRAWSTIQDLVNKIKGALDFTKRHSPSVLDIVNRGVRLVNSAMSNLDFTPALNQLPNPSDFGNMFDNINANSSIVNQSNIFNVNTGMDARTIAERLAFDLRNTQ